MVREPITAEVVEEIDHLLAQGIDPVTISGRLNLSEYVVRVIDGDMIGKGRRPPKGATDCRVVRSIRDVDVSSIRLVQRMLAGGWLNQEQIAREAGVSPNIVYDIALGRRPSSMLSHMEVGPTQVFLPDPMRCAGCGALLNVAPCHACYTRLVMMLDRWQKTFSRGFPRLTFRSWVLLDFLLKYLKRTRGAKTMQDVTSTLSTELAAFISAKDKREYLIARTEVLFDEVVEPIDLPGPDRIVDPLLRAAIRPLVGRIYDEMLKKLEAPVANAV